MAEIELKGRKIPLVYTTFEMKQIQKEIAPIGQAITLVNGRNPDDPEDMTRYAGAEHLDTIGKMIQIMGNAGLEEIGEVPDLTVKKILRGLRPSQIVDAVAACMDAMNEGMRSEIEVKKPEGPVDVVLEEINKKKEKTESLT